MFCTRPAMVRMISREMVGQVASICQNGSSSSTYTRAALTARAPASARVPSRRATSPKKSPARFVRTNRSSAPTDPTDPSDPTLHPNTLPSHIGQILVNELHRDGAFAHAGGDALDGAMADVAGGEDAGHARLQEVRVALQRPAAGPLRALGD